MRVEKVAQKVAGWINKSPKTQKVLRNISDNPALYNTIGATIVGTTIRPLLTIGVTPNKKDGIYSAASSVASSLVELAGGFLMFNPLRKAIDKSSKELYSSKGTAFFENKELLRGYKSTAQRVYRMFTFPVTSSIRFAMVAPIAAGLAFLGISKSKKDNKKLDVKA